MRFEYVERRLVVRPPPKQSLLRRFLRRLGSRTRIGRQIEGRPMIVIASAGRASREREPAESGGGGGDTLSATLPGGWHHCPRDARIGPGRSDSALTPGVPAIGFKAWSHWCGRGDLNSHVLSDNRF